MSTWFKGTGRVNAEPQRVAKDLESYGEHCAAVLRHMPGVTSAKLLSDKGDAITIKTNEGTMERTGIRKKESKGGVVIEFDEVYKAGERVSASSHYRHEFVPSDAGSEHRLEMSNVRANGFIGWVYRTFGARNIGRGVLKSYEQYYKQDPGKKS